MKNKHNHISRLIKDYRLAYPSVMSQHELSVLLGYKNGQFISNVERGQCGFPAKKLKQLSGILSIPQLELKNAILSDLREKLDNAFVIESIGVGISA